MHSVHCKYGIPFFSTLHTVAMVTKVLSVTECFRFVELLPVFTAPFKISSMKEKVKCHAIEIIRYALITQLHKNE
jgi:hypothetical protein